ncbi:tyrosine-protein kinase ABL1-like isoform X2 [Rhodamnia argentea]|uniref:Tyrosine-protein kinase ABL1-like isoform X2 n=1 Tax=Rhodamnia argentea TaxID=178133 RepID=A0ABM3HX84_9MYRT|nr:tyrosine-protein kinase ABL1-like isoform X2 [Rhodamnia argentea]
MFLFEFDSLQTEKSRFFWSFLAGELHRIHRLFLPIWLFEAGMEQFRQVGEVLGSMKALMVLQEDIQINRRQCCLLLHIFAMAFEEIASEIKQNLKLEEKNTKWKALEQPLRELHRVFKEGELYIKQCLDVKDFWGRAITFHNSKDCVEFHIHNLLCSFPAVIEAIENAGEISGLDPDEMQKKGILLRRKYDKEWNDPKLFQLRYGKQYLVPKELCKRLDTVWKEDRWLLCEVLKEKKSSESAVLTKNEQRLADLLLKKISALETYNWTLCPSSILTGAKDYAVRRRLGSGKELKEIQWLGESFVMHHLFGEVGSSKDEISTLLSLSHPNVLPYLCAFWDEEKKECFLVAELMNKSLACHVKENSSPRRRILFSLPVVVDIMIQIARGMEYLHSQKIYHGDLNPTNVLLKSRTPSEGYFLVKVAGYGSSTVLNCNSNCLPNQDSISPFIWYAPEVLAEQEKPESNSISKYSEKADVYSFGMICFQLLTGKIPFEEGHLQGDKMSRNIRTGERPLFSFPSPKYLVNLTRRCWQTEPSLRPSFSSICRILRNVKKFLVMNPENGHPELHSPPVDYCDIEAGFQKELSASGNSMAVTQIPFHMFAYKLAELDKTCLSTKVEICETASEAGTTCKDENLFAEDDSFLLPVRYARSVFSDTPDKKNRLTNKGTALKVRRVPEDQVQLGIDARSICSEIPEKRTLSFKKYADIKTRKSSGTPKAQDRASLLNPERHNVKITKRRDFVVPMTSSKSVSRGRLRGHVSDSEIQ